MARGGKRLGSERPAGVPNRRTQETQDAIEASGQSPLDYLIAVMRDTTQPMQLRVESARAAAPFVHAKLSATDVRLHNTFDDLSEAQLREKIALTLNDHPELKALIRLPGHAND